MKETIEQAAIKWDAENFGWPTPGDKVTMEETKTREWNVLAFKAGANWMKGQGNIQWFEIAKDGLPKVIETLTELGDYTKHVLITDGRAFHITQYVYSVHGSPIGWFGGPTLLLEPTHWAYINLPE